MTSNIYRAFNTIYEEFFNKMKLLMPEQDKIEDFHAGFLILKKANNRAPLEMFIGYIFDYSKQILDKNDIFFLDHNELSKIALDNSSFASKTGIREKWSSFSDDSKENIWTYLIGLTKLSFKAYGINNIQKCIDKKPKDSDLLTFLVNYQK